MRTRKGSYVIAGILFALLGAILFSAKAVLAKMIYRESSVSVVSVLTLRMFFSLPFYTAIFFYQLPKYRKEKEFSNNEVRQDILFTIMIGMLGYYISSFLDFSGLKYISAGLERIILFSYPTFTLLFAAFLYKTKIKLFQFLALLVSYTGVIIAFAGDIKAGHSTDITKGSLLIFGCAITYSLYVLWSGQFIPKMGVIFFTSVAMISATAGVFIHFLLSGHNFEALENLSATVYLYLVIMAVFTTVLPSFLLSAALKRIGSNNVAIISSIGPIATILQAYWFLGEKFGWLQALGTVLVVIGVLIIGRKVNTGE